MIKTTEAVSYNPLDKSKKSVVFAKVLNALRDDENETYTLTIKEWINITYEETVPNEQGEMELQQFTKEQELRVTKRVMTFAEADQLTAYLDSVFTITELGTARRKKYTLLGHLVINNQESVRDVPWTLA